MKLPKVERSRVDGRWCVYTVKSETLCPLWAVPFVWLWAAV